MGLSFDMDCNQMLADEPLKRRKLERNEDSTYSKRIPLSLEAYDTILNVSLRQELHALINASSEIDLKNALRTHFLRQISFVSEDLLVSASSEVSRCLSEFFGEPLPCRASQAFFSLNDSTISSILADRSLKLLDEELSSKVVSLRSLLHSRVAKYSRSDLVCFHKSLSKTVQAMDYNQMQGFPFNRLHSSVWFKVLSFLDFEEILVSCLPLNRNHFHLSTSQTVWSQLTSFRFGTRLVEKECLSAMLQRLPRVTHVKLGKHLPASSMSNTLSLLAQSSLVNSLRVLDFSSGPETIDDSTLRLIFQNSPLFSLQELNLAGCRYVSDDILKDIANFSPNLKSFNLKMCVRITDAGLFHIAQGCPLIESLSLRYCFNISNASLSAIASKCPRLTVINLRSCVNISSPGIRDLVFKCPLTKISLAKCCRIDDQALENLAKYCPQLEYAHFAQCRNISSVGVNALAEGCPNLLNIDFSRCPLVDDTSIILLASRCSKLQHICLKFCAQITSEIQTAITEVNAHVVKICTTHPGDEPRDNLEDDQDSDENND